ncbi:MAG TPA: ribonuclease R [Chitinophagales bacterium]|nr:ribonuclease R [Chitinophagales bacterium]
MAKKKKINKPTGGRSGNLAKDLLEFIGERPAKGQSLKNILKWSVKQAEGAGIFDAMEDLLYAQQIEEYQQDKFRLLQKDSGGSSVIGVVDITRSGNAYVLIDGRLNDVFVAARNTNRAFNGDTVRVRLRAGKKGKPEGEIVEVIKRARDTFIGHLRMNDGFAFVETDKAFNNYDFFIAPEEVRRSKAQDGERVIVRLKDWPPAMKSPIGQIVSRLQPAGDHESDMQAIMVETGIQYVFPKEVDQEAEKISNDIPEEEIRLRRDMRSTWTITIDPHDAKDFDDAISLKQLDNGRWEVGVHIADVSHYVTPGTAIDKEAYSRATSVYLVDRVIPMLPEKLSNNICSLVPHQDRLVFSAIFEMDEEGKVHKEWFGKSVIHSDRRFTYEEAQEVIEDRLDEYKAEIHTLNKIALALRNERFRKGAVAFETQEVKFILDENKKPVGLYVKERKAAHMLIEDLMLLANRKVAEFMSKVQPPVPFVFRVHDFPDMDRLEEFSMMARRFGYKVRFDQPNQVSARMNELMKEIQGKPEQNVLETMAIRCMAKAVYTTNNIGHYGLAFPHYTHFTSPIRRYPDLMVHRSLFHQLHNMPRWASKEELEEKCRHSSAMERKAMEAERESVKYKQVEFLMGHVGEEFDGVISGIQHYGIFVELVQNKCEGLVRTDSVRDELIYDEAKRELRSMTGGRTFRMGETVRIKVQKADLDARQLDFVLA